VHGTLDINRKACFPGLLNALASLTGSGRSSS